MSITNRNSGTPVKPKNTLEDAGAAHRRDYSNHGGVGKTQTEETKNGGGGRRDSKSAKTAAQNSSLGKKLQETGCRKKNGRKTTEHSIGAFRICATSLFGNPRKKATYRGQKKGTRLWGRAVGHGARQANQWGIKKGGSDKRLLPFEKVKREKKH